MKIGIVERIMERRRIASAADLRSAIGAWT